MSLTKNDVFNRFILFSTELLRGEVAIWSVLVSHTSEAVEIFVELCMLVMDKFKSAILPFILDSGSINGSSNSNNDKVEISSAPARSMHDLLLIRLSLRDFEEHFDSLYEACRIFVMKAKRLWHFCNSRKRSFMRVSRA